MNAPAEKIEDAARRLAEIKGWAAGIAEGSIWTYFGVDYWWLGLGKDPPPGRTDIQVRLREVMSGRLKAGVLAYSFRKNAVSRLT